MSSLNVVTTCTDRKRHPKWPIPQLRTVQAGEPTVRAQLWIEELQRVVAGQLLPASNLYAGDHWTVGQSLPQAVGIHIRLYVASAGYGLIKASDAIAAYSATFAPQHQDTVVPDGDAAQRGPYLRRWWSQLNAWSPSGTEGPRSLRAIAETAPSTPLIIVASDHYLRAMENDILRASEALDSPDLLSIVSVGFRDSSPLLEFTVGGDARLQAIVGGARQALNIRIARQVLSDVTRSGETATRTAMRKQVEALMKTTPPVSTPKRTPGTDEQVRAFIAEQRAIDPKLRHTPLLRMYRDTGHACEQTRFRRLYEEVVEQRA